MTQPEENIKPDRGSPTLDLAPLKALLYGGAAAYPYVVELLKAKVQFRIEVTSRPDKPSTGILLFDVQASLPIINQIRTSRIPLCPSFFALPKRVRAKNGEELVVVELVKKQLFGLQLDMNDRAFLTALKKMTTLISGASAETVVVSYGAERYTYLWTAEVEELRLRYLFNRCLRPQIQLRPGKT